MNSVRRIFFIIPALLFSFLSLYSYTIQEFYGSAKATAFSLFEENGRVGLKNDQGQVLIPAQYDAIGWSNNKFSVVNNVTGYRTNGLWGLLTIFNSKITKPEFEDLSPGEGALIVARKKIRGTVRVQAGCINTSGKEVIPFKYDGLRISALRAIVYDRIGNQFRHGLINFENKVLIPLNYQSIYPLGSLRYGVENFESKIAIFSEEGVQLTGFVIDSLGAFQNDHAIFYQNQCQGLIDRQGQIKLEPAFREIEIQDERSIKVRKSDVWMFLDGENKLLKQFNADSITVMDKNLLKITTVGKQQLTDNEFKPINDQLFSFIGTFTKGKALFKKDNKTGLIDRSGAIIIKPLYNALHSDGQFIRASQRINSKERWVLLDSVGNTLSQKNYEFIAPAAGIFFAVKNNNYWGALLPDGREIIACVHDSIVQSLDERVVVKFKGNYGIINLQEHWLTTPQPHKIKLVNDTLYLLITPKTKFLKSIKGQRVIYFTDNPIEVKTDYLLEYLPSGRIWKIDFRGLIADRYVRPQQVEEVFGESEGLRAIKKDGRYGFIDNRGRLRIANRYENVKAFSERLAAASVRGKWGFINHLDQIAIQPVYDEVASFNGGVALVKQKELFGLVDHQGKLVLPVRYEDVVVLPGKRFKIKQNGLWGLADTDGRLIINPKYDELTDLNNGYVIVARDKKFGVLTLQGISTIPLVYDGLVYDPFHSEYIAVKKASWETMKF